jgi:proteic killer suppression protein
VRYYFVVIRSFADADTELLWDTGKSRRIPANIRASALKKIAQLDSAERLEDLWNPPGNHLEALAGDRKGQHSIRINAQFRLCFVWSEGTSYDVEIVDYH